MLFPVVDLDEDATVERESTLVTSVLTFAESELDFVCPMPADLASPELDFVDAELDFVGAEPTERPESGFTS